MEFPIKANNKWNARAHKFGRIIMVLEQIPEENLENMVSIFSMEPEKLQSLIDLAEHIEYDKSTRSLTVEGDIEVKIKGEAALSSDQEFYIDSGHRKDNPLTGKPYSIRLNDEG